MLAEYLSTVWFSNLPLDLKQEIKRLETPRPEDLIIYEEGKDEPGLALTEHLANG